MLLHVVSVAMLAMPAQQPQGKQLAAETVTAQGSSLPTWSLPGGVTFPLLAVNTADLGQEVIVRAITKAVGMGIYNVDFHLGDEAAAVGKAVQDLGRQSLFLTTKLDKPDPTITDQAEAADLARAAVDDVLAAVGGTVDMLILKDSPSCPVMQAQWAVLEGYLSQGKTRALGTYNFCQYSLDCILGNATKAPTVNYLMRHLGMGPDATGIIEYGASRGVKTAAYGTLGEPIALEELMLNGTVREIAQKYGRTIEEVALRWNAQAGHAITNRITSDYAPDNAPLGGWCTDDCAAAITAMAHVYDWSIEPEDMETLDKLRFLAYPQSPTYYSSEGCANSYGVSDHPTASACAAFMPKYATAWC